MEKFHNVPCLSEVDMQKIRNGNETAGFHNVPCLSEGKGMVK